MNESTIGVALSGGGHRASAWALGALLYLHDAGLAARVKSISSVSGGSITNAWFAARTTWSSSSAGEMESLSRELGGRLATRGTIFEGGALPWIRRSLLPLAIVCGLSKIGLLVGALGSWLCAWPFWIAGASAVALVVSVVLLLFVLGIRGRFVAPAYDRTVCADRILADLPSTDEHVFCATDVQLAEHCYFSKKFVYAYRYGVGVPVDFRLSEAVAASAGFPFAFPPRAHATARFSFVAGASSAPPSRLRLLDGGIYDNMGEQWLDGMPKRLSGKDPDPRAAERGNALADKCALRGRPDEMIVVNASPAFAESSIGGFWPFSEARSLANMISAMHDNSTSLRRRNLVERFVQSSSRGVLVHIGTDPWAQTIVPALRGDFGVEAKARAEVARTLLSGVLDAGEAAALRDRNQAVGTTLDPLGVDAATDLLWHAYLLSAIQTHVHLGHALPADANRYRRDRFRALAAGH